MQQVDDQFNGVISGYQTQILLNSERLIIKIESHSKENLFEAVIQYKNEDTILKQVKKTFKNLTLLYEYINQFSEDPQRIKIDLNRSQMKIIKNDGPRRLKNSPVLLIPLNKKFVFQKKQKTSLQIQVQTALKQNEILQFKFSHLKRQRNKLINQYQEIQKWMKGYCEQNQINWNLVDQNNDKEHQKETRNRTLGQKSDYIQLQQMLDKNSMSHIEQKQSLFFESEPIFQEKYELNSNIREFFDKNSLQSGNFLSNKQNSLSFDPFSYM